MDEPGLSCLVDRPGEAEAGLKQAPCLIEYLKCLGLGLADLTSSVLFSESDTLSSADQWHFVSSGLLSPEVEASLSAEAVRCLRGGLLEP